MEMRVRGFKGCEKKNLSHSKKITNHDPLSFPSPPNQMKLHLDSNPDETDDSSQQKPLLTCTNDNRCVIPTHFPAVPDLSITTNQTYTTLTLLTKSHASSRTEKNHLSICLRQLAPQAFFAWLGHPPRVSLFSHQGKR